MHPAASSTKQISPHPHGTTTFALSEILGDVTTPGQPTTLGQLLCLIDATGGGCAHRYAARPVVTGCFDSIDVLLPPAHGDIVTCYATLLCIGSRSMFIQIDAYINSRTTPTPPTPSIHCIRALCTFIANPGDPLQPLTISETVQYGMTHVNTLSKSLKLARQKLLIRPSTPVSSTYFNESGRLMVKVQNTHIQTKRYFLPRHMNFANVVFGGEILNAIEIIAVTAGSKLFNTTCHVRSMRAISFWKAVPPFKVLNVDAIVVGIRNSIACVFVQCNIGDVNHPSHTSLVFVSPSDKSVGVDVAIEIPSNVSSNIDSSKENGSSYTVEQQQNGQWTDEQYEDVYQRALSLCTCTDLN